VPYDSIKLWDVIVGVVAAPGKITPRMQELIDFCAAAIPHDEWARLRCIDYDTETSSHLKWFAGLEAAAKGQSSKGVWFGLVNPIREGKATLDLYGATSAAYDPNGLTWARSINRSTKRFVGSQVLGEIYSTAYATGDDSLENDAEYPLALGFGAMAARAILETRPLTGFLDQIVGAAVGFDSGDFLYLGEVRDGRFIANVRGG
jgi:hypothetical protein